MEVKIKKLFDDAIIPTHGSEYAAGYDLYAYIKNESGTVQIAPHRMMKINTGISIALPHDTFGGIYARSGLATKRGLRLCNCVGVVDSDYEGEVLVALYNDSDEVQEVKDGERIAQLVIQPYVAVDFKEVDELPHTKRGDGGFGSTGK